MKHNYSLIAIIALIMSALTTQTAKAQDDGVQVITFLKNKPTKNINECTEQDLMDLLTDDSKEWVESIEFQNVKISADKYGVILYTSNTTESYLKINLKKDKLMKTYRVICFGADESGDNTIIKVYYNDDYIYENYFGISKNLNTNDKSIIMGKITGKINSAATVPTITNQTELNNIPLKSIMLSIPATNRTAVFNDQILGFRILYRGFEDESSSDLGYQTLVDEIDRMNGNLNVEYFDMMGRRLPEKPQTGIYIRKIGSKTEKLIAR